MFIIIFFDRLKKIKNCIKYSKNMDGKFPQYGSTLDPPLNNREQDLSQISDIAYTDDKNYSDWLDKKFQNSTKSSNKDYSPVALSSKENMP
jgi:hypothetical protein